MKQLTFIMEIFVLAAIFSCSSKNNTAPISLHPENPNYFLYNGKPTVLISSGEHYGAVMNMDFDYVKYLNALKNDGLNYTRIFMGSYSEIGSEFFGIRNNTMNPTPGKWLTPWVNDSVIGKYDLSKWNEPFFKRLKSFLLEAEKNGIIVEVTLFTSYYSENQWSNSPFNTKNNIQGFDSIFFKNVNTMENGRLMDIQEQYVRKIVKELISFNNIFFEVQNEPWADNPNHVETLPNIDTLIHPFAWQKIVETANIKSMDWQKRIAEVIGDEERDLTDKHLIAQNISNFRYKLPNSNPKVSIINFHYALPEAASDNMGLNKAIALDETGFMPHNDFHYRSQAWKFLLAGGATYNNLDYSFTVGHEDGSYNIDEGTPGWGGPAYRKQLSVLKQFMERFDFLRMKPSNEILKVNKGELFAYQILAEKGIQYALYLEKAKDLEFTFEIPDGEYNAVWINPITGKEEKKEEVVSKNNIAILILHGVFEDKALILKKNK